MDACATAHGLELLGDRWNYPILRELMLAPKRFAELEASVRGITPAMLTSRLRELEAVGLVARTELPGRAAGYECTDWAREAAPALDAIGRWAVSSPTKSPGGRLTPDAALQSMRTMASAGPLAPLVQLDLHLWAEILFQDRPLGSLELSGDRAAVERLVAQFHAPRR
ncbi:winged helix-turn-helix transcriptional regulator [Sinomonas mesophila]|uniref:winged helix-turn-helix transcriptional regulator n=1 Tax=Sinomonas mesophila TaxID=1531955 RepID=UPI000984E2E9|nr:helix-turn-helix domain-containing protein [Sinomonas mesophila]